MKKAVDESTWSSQIRWLHVGLTHVPVNVDPAVLGLRLRVHSAVLKVVSTRCAFRYM